MLINIADKGIKLDEEKTRILYKNLEKLNKILPNFKPDLATVNFFIRRNDDKYKVYRKHRHIHKDYLTLKPGLAHFEGWIRLIVPRKALYSHFKGATVEECIHYAAKHLTAEVKKYKELHFKSQSRYPHRESIRQISKNDKVFNPL
jgi:hypothetical protein